MLIHIRRFGFALCLLLAITLLPMPTTRAAERSLFGRTAAFADMNISPDPVVTSDKRFVLFRADLEIDGVYNLYRVPFEGGQPVKLNGAVTAGRGLRQFVLSPDGTRIVYTSSQDVENRDELYSVPVEGGAPVKLNSTLPTGGNVNVFYVTSNSATVIYSADQTTNDVFELYSVPLAGGTVKKLNSPLVLGGDVVDDFRLSHNDQFVVYRADQEANDRYELYSVPLAGGAVEKLNGALVAGGYVDYFRLSPVLNIAVYAAKEVGDSAYALYSVQLNGNPIGKINGTLPAGKRVTYLDITPDGSRVSYVVGNGFSSPAAGTLFAVSIFGGASAQLSPTPSADGDVGFVRISADSKYAVFSFKPNSTATATLYSALLDGGEHVTLYNIAANHGLYDLNLSPDSGWVVFSDDDQTPGASNETVVYAVPLTGGNPVQLSANNEQAFSPLISPLSDRVVYNSFVPNNPACEESNLQSVQVFGGGRRTLTGLCGKLSNINDVQWTTDGQSLLYIVEYDVIENEQRKDAGFELWISDGQALPPTTTPTATATITPTTLTTTATTTPTTSSTEEPTPSATGSTQATPSASAQPTQTTNPSGSRVYLPVVLR